MLKVLIITAIITFCFGAFAQTEYEVLAEIRKLDSVFWSAYNKCDVDKMRQLFTDDIEFYHDKGGITRGLDSFMMSVKRGLCGNENFRLRRAEVKGTVQVFPMANSGKIYGAIISGDHNFFINEKGKPEYISGLAKFNHLWLLQNGTWKMARVLSFDHGPAGRR